MAPDEQPSNVTDNPRDLSFTDSTIFELVTYSDKKESLINECTV
jgi:hypothetical protein